MDLNLHLIAEELAPLHIDSHLLEGLYDMPCAYPLPYRAPATFARTPLYVARGSELPPRPVAEPGGLVSLVSIGLPPAAYLRNPFNTLVVTSPATVVDVQERLLEIFHRYYEWEKGMQDVIDAREPLKRIGELSEPFLGNPFFMQGSGFQCIFHIDDFPAMHRGDRYERYRAVLPLEDDTYYPLEMIVTLTSDPAYTRAIGAVGPTMYVNAAFDDGTLYYNGGRSLFLNLFEKESCIARIIIPEIAHEFTDRDLVVVSIMGAYLNRALHARTIDNYTRPGGLDEILQQLLAHHLIDENRIASVLHELGWNISDQYLCMVLDPKSGEQSPEELRALTLQMLPHLTSDCYLVFEGRVVLVFNLSRTGISRDDTVEHTIPVLRDSLLAAGISAAFPDFKNLFYYYHQALDALMMGRKRDPTVWYFRYEDYLLDIMVARCLDGQIRETFWPEGLERLAVHDRVKSTRYLEVLRTYLKNNMNVAETSRKLYLQRNTCLYQLGRIREISKLDLDDADVRVELLLAFRIYDDNGSTPAWT